MSLSTGQVADVEFRFAAIKGTTTKEPQLQFRKLISVNNWSCQWTDWRKVPLVVVVDSEIKP